VPPCPISPKQINKCDNKGERRRFPGHVERRGETQDFHATRSIHSCGQSALFFFFWGGGGGENRAPLFYNRGSSN